LLNVFPFLSSQIVFRFGRFSGITSGDRGVYFVAVLSGLTDVDAITLSTAQLVNKERLAGETGWRVIVLACLANLIGKAALVAILGQRQLFRIVSLSYAVVIVAGALLMGFW